MLRTRLGSCGRRCGSRKFSHFRLLLVFPSVRLIEFIVISFGLSSDFRPANKSKLRKPHQDPDQPAQEGEQAEKSHSGFATAVVKLFITFSFQPVVGSCLLGFRWADVATE